MPLVLAYPSSSLISSPKNHSGTPNSGSTTYVPVIAAPSRWIESLFVGRMVRGARVRVRLTAVRLLSRLFPPLDVVDADMSEVDEMELGIVRKDLPV
jgi:hypothetical protein